MNSYQVYFRQFFASKYIFCDLPAFILHKMHAFGKNLLLIYYLLNILYIMYQGISEAAREK